jgi:hypothetical protein
MCRSNPRLPITRTNTTSIIKQAMTNATLLQTQVPPNDCGIRRGSGCSLRAPCSISGLRRWLSRSLCRTCRGRWPDPLPSSSSLGWWHLHFTAGCGESQPRAERSADECSAPPSHPSGVPSPSWGYPFSPRRPRIDLSFCRAGGSGPSSATGSCSYGPTM